MNDDDATKIRRHRSHRTQKLMRKKVTSKVLRGPGESVRITNLSVPGGSSNPHQWLHDTGLVEPQRSSKKKLVSQQWAWLHVLKFTHKSFVVDAQCFKQKARVDTYTLRTLGKRRGPNPMKIKGLPIITLLFHSQGFLT